MTREEALAVCYLLGKIEQYEDLYEEVEKTFNDYRIEDSSLKDATLNCIATALQELKNELALK